MRSISTIFVIALSLFALFGCSSVPQDKTIAKIGNTALFASDAEFLVSIRPEAYRDKRSVMAELQQAAETRRNAEVARLMFAGEQNSIQKNLAEEENARLAQVYSYFYLQANLGQTNKALLDFYKKNKSRFPDSAMISADMPLGSFREQLAAELLLETPDLAALANDSNKAALIDSCRRAISGSEVDRLKKVYNVELVKIEPPGAEDYYKAHPDEFQTKTGYKLLSLSHSDSSVLAGKIKGISTRDNFAKIATELPVVKQGHAIIGIGMFPALDGEVSKLGAKNFTSILRAPDTQAYYVFYIDSVIAPQLKPWDRAKHLAKSILENKGDFPLDSSTVLATIGGKPFITEKEVLELQAKVPPQRRSFFRREASLNNLIERNLYAKAAKEKGLDKSYEYIAWTRQLTDQAYARILMDSLLTKTLGVPEDSLKAAYNAEKDSLFWPKTFDDSKIDIAVWLRIPDISYKREFLLNRENYEQAENWESIKRTIYKNIRYREFSGIQERELANLHKSVPVTIIDTTWGLEFASNNFAELIAQAKAQYDNRNLQKAKSLWERVRILFPQNDSAQKIASFELANIYQELGSYAAAIDEYKAITKLWENAPDVYKAYFMKGFVLSEYEKNDSLALIAFEELLRKFPNSELSGDAKIMVENIKSGGKVFEDLIKKIETSTEE